MKTVLPFIAWMTILSPVALLAQVSGNYQHSTQQSLQSASRRPASSSAIAAPNEISVAVNGLANVVADSYVAWFNIIQVGETMESADQLMNARIAAFVDKCRDAGVDAGQISVDLVSFVPKFDIQTEVRFFSKTYNEIPAGFELQKNVSIRYNQSDQLNFILSAAAASEIYDIIKVDYFVADFQKHLDDLRQKCLQELKTKKKVYEAMGFQLDTLKKAMNDNFNTVYPQTRYFTYQAFSRPSLAATKKKSSAQPALTEVPKNTSKFYSPVDYDLYDIVVNPVVTEPVVQISYSATVKYYLPQEEIKPDPAYYIITPAGDVKPLTPPGG
jgi:uncharacterized protein YggE